MSFIRSWACKSSSQADLNFMTWNVAYLRHAPVFVGGFAIFHSTELKVANFETIQGLAVIKDRSDTRVRMVACHELRILLGTNSTQSSHSSQSV